ncbi:MAG: hypothetical protein QF440_00775 [Candidatus Thalassarchaeaceae archaeon]|jgi:hypothetical protein|nr:hypothetical protein [Candidatus Thalassarchaeaceae archaeon]
MAEGLAGQLQHPRRSLGDRHRAQASKFLRLAKDDPLRQVENVNWAEQSARQSLLFDFTNEENWNVLAEIKTIKNDEIGLRALLSDLFSVLGRDPEQIQQLSEIPILEMGLELVTATLNRDSLDAEIWATNLTDSKFNEFVERFSILDLSDPRCNVLFSRRLQQIWKSKGDEVCIPLARIILAQRPQNFEMWTDLGRVHERNSSYDNAWFCYDQAQNHAPHSKVRDQFKNRMQERLDSGRQIPWSSPSVNARDEFLTRMEELALNVSAQPEPVVVVEILEEGVEINAEEDELISVINSGNHSAAFFLARRLVSRGESWAEPYLEKAKILLEGSDEVNIP